MDTDLGVNGNLASMDPVLELLKTYSELNSSEIGELTEAPSALEFMRFVARNRPFVLRGGITHWKAVKAWDESYLRERLRDQLINVAVTPQGKADAPLQGENGSLLFVKPLEEEEQFGDFLSFIIKQELRDWWIEGEEVRYAQSQNDNLNSEYASLLPDIERDIPWARIALQTKPEALNLWIGNSRSMTALHKDNYENIYCQIVGEKHFILVPPVAHACVEERWLAQASYCREGKDGFWAIKEDGKTPMPFPTWDPDEPRTEKGVDSQLVKPMRVTLRPGDILYLPSMW